jgi:hypothetical protein
LTLVSTHLDFSTDIDASNGYFTFSKQDYIGYVTSYDQPFIFFITARHIVVKAVVDGRSMRHVANLSHRIENLYYEYVYGFCTHGYIALLKRHTLYFFRLSDDKQDTTYEAVYPSNYFDVKQFTNITGVNSWNNTVIAKTDRNEVHVLDFRSVVRPTAYLLHLPPKPPEADITFVKAVNRGLSGAVFFGNSLEIYDLISRNQVKAVLFPYTVLYINYDYVTNSLIVLFKEKKGIAINTAPPFNRKFFDSPHVDDKPRILRTGTGCLALLQKRTFTIFDLTAASWATPRIDLAELYRGNLYMPFNDSLLAGYSFTMTYRLSNLILVSKDDKLKDLIEIRHLRLHTDDNTLCHKTCKNKCIEPFIVCKQNRQLVYSMLFGGIIACSIVVICYRACTVLEKILNENKSPIEKNKVRAFRHAVGVRNETIVLRKSLLTKSMLEALEDCNPPVEDRKSLINR